MEGKLQELTDRLYKDGVEKASQEAKGILEKAHQEAEALRAKAATEASSVVNSAKAEAEQLKSKALAEIKMAGEQAVATLKSEITNLLATSALSASVKSAVDDAAFVKDLVKDLLAKWDPQNPEVALVLPEKKRADFDKLFQAKAGETLGKGVELKFETRMEGGFRLEPRDGSFVLSFTDRDFQQFFQSFLKVRAKEILFPSPKV